MAGFTVNGRPATAEQQQALQGAGVDAGLASQAMFRGSPIMAVLGNSYVSSHGYNANDTLARGFGQVLAARLKDRVRVGPMLGFAGQSSTVIAPYIDTILAAGARVVVVEMLINDVPGGLSYATSVANINRVAKACQDAGAICVFQTIPPRSDASNTTALRQGNARINDYLFTLPFLYRNVYVADVASQLTSRASSTGTPISLVLQSDGVHPLDLSGELTSQPYFDVLDKLLPPIAPGVWQTLLFDRTNYPTGYVRDPSMTGSSGTAGAGITGSVATSWNLARTIGSTFTATASKVPGVNGGEYQQIVLGGAGAGLGTEQITMSYNTTLLQLADIIQGLADISATGLSNVKGVYAYISGATTGTYRALLNSGLGNDLSPAAWDRLLRTYDPTNSRDVQLLATETVTFGIAIVGKCDGTAPTGTITIKRAGIKVVIPA